MLLGEPDDSAYHRQIRIHAGHVKFPDCDVPVPLQPFFKIAGQRLVAQPTGGLPVLPVRSQLRHDQIGRLCVQLLRAVVAGTGHERPQDTGLAQERDRLPRRDHLPGVVVIVDMSVEQRKLGRLGARRCAEQQDKRNSGKQAECWRHR